MEDNWLYDLSYKDEGSDKFWRARVEQRTLFVNFGRNGTRGATQIKVFPDKLSAVKEMVARATEKLDKGYHRAGQLRLGPAPTPLPAFKYVQPVPYENPFWTQGWKRATPVKPAYDAAHLDQMPEHHFTDLAARVATEKRRREVAIQETKAKKNDAITAFQNFLLGAAHAMACRAALRWSAGHPPIGKGRQHGLPWNAYDGAKLDNMVKTGVYPQPKNPTPGNLRWASLMMRTNPLLWTTAGDIKAWLNKTNLPSWARGGDAALWYY